MFKTIMQGLFITLWVIIIESTAFAAVSFPGWIRIGVGNVGSLQYPPTMEIQNDSYRSISGAPSPGYNNIILQQYGLNQMTPDGRSRYARVIFNTKNSDFGISLYDNLSFTQSELSEINDSAYNSTVQELAKINNRILTWEPVKVININGVDCLYQNYKRQMSNNPVVTVYSFTFFNNRYMHTLTVSFRDSERSYWNAPGYDIRNVIHTLEIKPL
jgi:hypothetical protein